MIEPGQTSLGILAGGRASRLGGIDKAFAEFQGETLLARTLRNLPEPFAARLLSYNRSPGFALPGIVVVPDLRPGQPGPLAALEALFQACRTHWLLTAPVDIRHWPPELVARLLDHAVEAVDGCAIADADGLQPLVGIWKVRALQASVASALDAGERAVHRWFAAQALPVLDIAPFRLGNLNTAGDFADATR